jgi:hypothetical protein
MATGTAAAVGRRGEAGVRSPELSVRGRIAQPSRTQLPSGEYGGRIAMTASFLRAGLLAVLIAAAPALAQDAAFPLVSGGEDEVSAIPASRLVAGVREYPARVLRSLLQLADDPLVLRQLADEPDLLERPEAISPPVPAEMHAAIRELSVMPAIVAVAADHPTELQALRELYAEAPDETEEYILQLRMAYDDSALGAVVAWQELLERDPAALKEYAELVTRFCKKQREAYEGFPCVQVSDRKYYYACPPSEAIIFYALDHAESSVAMQAIEQWWETYAPSELDARILGGNANPVDFELRPDTVAVMPPEQRAAMWQVGEGARADLADLVPVIMQPPADQPPEALYARAVAEHARLWTPEMPAEAPEEFVDETPEESGVTWPTEEGTSGLMDDDWEYVEEPVQNVVYEDDGWDYASNWDYGPTAYWPTRYRTYQSYYAPIAGYYCGYPVDWPLFYGCDPGWLVRFRICIGYTRCGHGVGVHRSHRTSRWTSACFGIGGRAGGYDGCWWRGGAHDIVRVGRRHYYRCASNEIARVLHHQRTCQRRSVGSPPPGGGHTWYTAASSPPRFSTRGFGPDSHPVSASNSGVGRLPAGQSSMQPRSMMDRLRQAVGGTERHATRGTRPDMRRPSIRSGTPQRSVPGGLTSESLRSGRAVRPSAGGGRSSSGVDHASQPRPTSRRPQAVTPRRSNSTSGSPSTSPRPRPSSPPASVTPRRSGSPSRSPGVSSRSQSGSKPASVTPRRSGSPSRSPSTSPRPRPSSPSASATPRRSGSPNRSPGVSSRSRSSPKPASATPRRSGSSSRSPGVSSRSRSGSKPASATPRRSGSSSRSPGARSRGSASPKRTQSGTKAPTKHK